MLQYLAIKKMKYSCFNACFLRTHKFGNPGWLSGSSFPPAVLETAECRAAEKVQPGKN